MIETRPIRVLVVDDSTAARRIVARALRNEPRIEVVGAAANGRIALAKVESLRPDVITLDLEMPEMSGFEALAALRRNRSAPPVIVFTEQNETGAIGTLAALQAGAIDFVTKPPEHAKSADAVAALQTELIPKILALHDSAQRRAVERSDGVSALRAQRSPASSPEIIAIGASTGGPRTLQAILSTLPARFPVPIVVVQHMPATFTAKLARSLHQHCEVDVHEGLEGAVLGPGQVWIAPGDHHMTVERSARGGLLHIDQGPKENSCRPSVDVLFRSVAKAYGSRALALVLTGMGSDGTEGAWALRQAGARVVIQDEASSVVWGMPGSVALARLADQVLGENEIAAFLRRSVEDAEAPRIGRR